jgi:hypothetical protein
MKAQQRAQNGRTIHAQQSPPGSGDQERGPMGSKEEAMSTLSTRLIFNLLLFALLASDASAAEYRLMPSPQTVHIGHFSAALKPVLTINSGDIVTIETATHIDPAEVDHGPWSRPAHSYRSDLRQRAVPGDVLELRILEVDLAVPYGFTPAHWRKNFPASSSVSFRSIAKPRRPRSHPVSSFH